MLNVKIQDSAAENLDFIFEYIADDNKQIAIKVIQSIDKSIKNLQVFPYMGKEFGSLREFVECKYKFRIVYQIDLKKNLITIISIFKNQNTF